MPDVRSAKRRRVSTRTANGRAAQAGQAARARATAARAVVEERYGWVAIAEQTDSVYRSVAT